jgi:putative ABC transport system permease protein
MSVGAMRKDILRQFLAEAVVLSLAGGLVGIAIGVVASEIVARVQSWSVLISAPAILAAFLFAGVVGVFFGFYPAWKAARLSPIEALRYE